LVLGNVFKNYFLLPKSKMAQRCWILIPIFIFISTLNKVGRASRREAGESLPSHVYFVALATLIEWWDCRAINCTESLCSKIRGPKLLLSH